MLFAYVTTVGIDVAVFAVVAPAAVVFVVRIIIMLLFGCHECWCIQTMSNSLM